MKMIGVNLLRAEMNVWMEMAEKSDEMFMGGIKGVKVISF